MRSIWRSFSSSWSGRTLAYRNDENIPPLPQPPPPISSAVGDPESGQELPPESHSSRSGLGPPCFRHFSIQCDEAALQGFQARAVIDQALFPEWKKEPHP